MASSFETILPLQASSIVTFAMLTGHRFSATESVIAVHRTDRGVETTAHHVPQSAPVSRASAARS